jgi:hypothetical protein
MEDITLFLLQLLGPIFLLAALGFFLNGESYEKLMKKIDTSSLAFIMTGYASLTVGLAIVLQHNLWVTPGEIIVSLFGWAALIKGGLLILSPKSMTDLSEKIVKGWVWTVAPAIWLVLGAYMTWLAYFV